MSKFICRNEECSKFGTIDEYLKNSYKLINGQFISNNSICPECGKMREELVVDIPLSEKTIEIGKYSSASGTQKREILKKRSHEHFKKEIKPFKEHKLNETINKFKNL